MYTSQHDLQDAYTPRQIRNGLKKKKTVQCTIHLPRVQSGEYMAPINLGRTKPKKNAYQKVRYACDESIVTVTI